MRLQTLADLDDPFLEAWEDLYANSSIANPFASPSYTLAAARFLPEAAPPLILSIEQQGQLQGLAVFESVSGSRRLPVKHLRSWQTPHTYFDSPLLRQGAQERTIEEFWNYFLNGRHEWHGVEFPRFPNHEPISELLDESATTHGITCLRGTCWERASLSLDDNTADAVMQHLSAKRSRSLRRGWRELEKQGAVRFEILQDREGISRCADELLHLENLGWKSKAGTSLLAQADHERFFREMIRGMNQHDNVFFSRILIDDTPIISVAHLRANDTAYAFKLGWDSAYERGCPGFQIMLKTAAHAHQLIPEVKTIDSCSTPGSFIEHIWPHRRSFCTRTYVISPVGNIAAGMLNGLRWVRNNARAVSRQLFASEGERQQS